MEHSIGSISLIDRLIQCLEADESNGLEVKAKNRTREYCLDLLENAVYSPDVLEIIINAYYDGYLEAHKN